MEIKKFAVTDHKIKAVVYGSSGTGKTSFGGTAKNAIFASAEGGLLAIADKQPNYVEIKSLNDLRELLNYLKTQPHKYETVIIDSITEINEIIKADIEKKTGKAMEIKDWGTLAKNIKEILRGFRDLPMHVLFIAQESTEKDGDVVTKVVPSLNGKAATEIAYFMDIVGYLYMEKATGARKLITLPNSMYLTKDRSKVIGNDTPADFSAWVEKISKIALGTEEVVTNFAAPVNKEGDVDVNAAPAPQAPLPTAPAAPRVSFFDNVKARIETLNTIEHLSDAYQKLDAIKSLTEEHRNELKAIISEKIEAIELEALNQVDDAQPEDEVQIEGEENPLDDVVIETKPKRVVKKKTK